MDQTEDVTLTKQILNNYIMKNKHIACKSKKFVIDKLIRQVKKLRQKKAKSEEQKKLFERKADRLVEEAVILKRIRAATVLKFGILNKKSFGQVVSSPDCKIEERALCRLMEQKHLHEVVCSFRKNYPHYELEVPLILQTLGLQKINNRKKKISILRKWDKLDPYLQTEELNVMIMKDLLGIDINTGILRFCKGKKFEEFGKISGRDRETKQRIDAQIRNMNNNSIEKTDLTKIKESTNKGNLIIEEVTGNDDKYILDISVSPSHEQSEGQVNENEEEGNEEDSVDQGESSDVDEEDSGDVLHQEEENNDDHVKQLHQDEESNDVDLEKDSHGDNSEDDSGDIIEQIDDSTKNSKDIWGYKSNIVKSEKVGEKILVKRKLIETCHYGGGLIGNKHYKTLPSKIKKSCNMPDPLPARNQKINGSGIAEVRILSLSEHDGVIERCDSIKSDSSEEDFFFRDEAKKKDKQRNLFDSYENPEDSIRMQSKDNRKGYDQDSDIIDTSIYFKRNMYRKVGETENRDQGQESRGSDIDIRGSGRGRLSQRNNNKGNNDSRGRPSWRNNDSRGRPSWRNNDSERSRPSWRNDSIRNKGNFERRGGKWKFSHNNPNEIPVERNWEARRKKITDARDLSNNNRQKGKAVSFESSCTAVCRRSSMVDDLLLSIYRHNRRSDSIEESDTLTEHSTTSETPHVASLLQTRTVRRCPSGGVVHRRSRLVNKDVNELRLLVASLQASLSSQCAMLIRELKRRDKLHYRRDQQNDVITAILHALSQKRSQDTRMRFSVAPLPGDSGFMQWHDAMMMCARLPGGIPQEFRRRLWLTLSEKHLQARGVDWSHAERFCFNEWSNPDDDELGDQIVKDLHRTGCSLFCGEEAEDNQAMLKRVLLAYARWNKAVGYCQGFNMLAAIILEVMERQESDALKVMIYLIEGVLPESYFANNLRGLSVDMAVFRDLLRLRLPHLSRHLEHLQHDAADLATGTSYEPPLTNVFTMQWFLTLFSNCLPRETVMRVWDLTFLQGDEVLLRTALAIWDGLAVRILDVHSADEFYTVMGVLTQEMLTYGLMDANKLVQTVVGMAPFPFPGLAELRDKYTYNITPWTQSVSSVAKRGLRLFYSDDDDDDNDEDDQKIAVATAFGLSGIFRKGVESRGPSPVGGASSASPGTFVPLGFPSSRHAHEISRPNLDISALKKQYARLRERQKQAHIILTASQLRVGSSLSGGGSQRSTPLAMNHLLRGKKALTSKTKRGAPQGVIPVMEPKKKVERKFSDSTGARPAPQAQKVQLKSSTRSLRSHYQSLKRPPSSFSQSPPKVETLHWKDTPRRDRRASLPSGVKLLEAPAPSPSALGVQDEADDAEGGSSTSTELCDDEDEDKLSDLETDATAEGRPATTSPRLETVTELRTPSPAKQQRKKQEVKAIISERQKSATDKEIELKPEAKLLIKEPQEISKPEMTVQTGLGNEPTDKSEMKFELELEAVEIKLEDAKADIKPFLREEQEETETSFKLGEIKVKTGLVERSEEESVKQAKLEDRIKKIIPENKLLEIESQKKTETLKSEEIKPESKPGRIKAEKEAEMIKSEIKPKEIKPESKVVEIKPEIKPTEITPQFKVVEIKPATESVEIKPEIKEITEHAVVESLEIKPETISVETKPEIKSIEIKPQMKVEIKPELQDITELAAVESLEIISEIKTVQVKAAIESVEIKPEIISVEMKPEIKSVEIKNEMKVEMKPGSQSVEVKPESKAVNIKPELNTDETKVKLDITAVTLKNNQKESEQVDLTPKDKQEEFKQEGKIEEFEAEDILETVRAENKLPEMQPKEIRLENKADEIKLEKQTAENIPKEIKHENEVEEIKVKSEQEDTKPEARVEMRLEEQSATVPDMGQERQDATVRAGWEETPYKEMAQEGVRESETSKGVQENIVQGEKSGKTKFDKKEEEEPIELKLAEGIFEWTKLDFTQEEIKPEEITEHTASLPLSPHLAPDEVAVQAENPPPNSLYSPSYAFSYGIPLEVLLAGKNLTAAEIIARIPFPSDVSFMKGPEEIDKFSAQHNVTPQRSPIETTFPDFPSLVPVSETSLTVKMSPDSSPSLSPSPSPRTSPISASPHRSLTNTPSISPNTTQETKASINWSQTELPSTPPESRMSSPLIPPKSPKITVEDEKKNVFEIHSGVPRFSTFVFHPLEETGEKSLSNICSEAEYNSEKTESDAIILPREKVQKSKDPNMTNKNISDSPIHHDTPFVETQGFSTESNARSHMERPTCETTEHFSISINIQEGTETKDVILSDVSLKHGIKDLYTIGNEDTHEVTEENDIDVSPKVLTFRESISKSRLSTMLTDDAEKKPDALTTDSFKTDTFHDVCYLQSSSSLETESQYPTVPEVSDITQSKVASTDNESHDIQLGGTEICLRTEFGQSKAAISRVDVLKPTSPVCSSEKPLPVVPLVTHLVTKTEMRVSETHTEESKTTRHTGNDKSLLLHSQIKSSLLSMDDVSESAGNQELEQKSSFSKFKDSYHSSQANISREYDVGRLDNSISFVKIPLESNILAEVTREDREFVHTQRKMYKTDVTARLSAAETVVPSKISLEERISALLPPETLATWTAKYECDKVVSLSEEPGGLSKQQDLPHTDKSFETNLPLIDDSQDEAKILIIEVQGERFHSELCKKESEPVPTENSQTSKQSTVGTADKADQALKKFFDDSKLLLIENNGNITKEKVRKEIQCSPTEPISKDKNLPPATEYHIDSDMLPSYKEGIQRTTAKGYEESALLLMKDEMDAQLGKIQYSTPKVCSLFVERSSDIAEFAIDKLSQETELGATKKSQKGTIPVSKTPFDVKPCPLEITKPRESTDELASSQMATDDESINCLGDVQEASQPPFRRQRGESSLTTSLEGRISAFPCRIDSEENILSFEETIEDDAVFESSGPEMETDFFSEKDLSSEAIRQRLWRGVKSLSLDADITLDPDIFCFLIQQSTKSSHNKEGKRKGLQKRRNSEVELQELVKENTEIIERIMKQKSVEDAGALIYSIKETDTPANTPIEEHEHEIHSVKSNSDRELESYTKSSSSSTEPHELPLAKSNSSDLCEALSLAKELRSPPSKEMPSGQVSSLDRKMSGQNSDTEPTAKSTSAMKPSSKTTKISRSSSVSLEGPMRPITFNPFPTRNVPRQPKEVAIKLGLYSPTKTSSSSPT